MNKISETEKLLETHVPLRKISNRKLKYICKPWIDNETQKEIRKQNTLFRIKKLPGCSQNDVENYKIQKNKVTSMKRKKESAYFKEYFQKHRRNSKMVWEGINLALNRNRKNKKIPTGITDADDKKISSDQNLANEFAKYFESVPVNCKNKILKNKGTRNYKYYLGKTSPNRRYLVLNPATPSEVHKIILKIKSNSSPGPLKVPNAFIKLIMIC